MIYAADAFHFKFCKRPHYRAWNRSSRRNVFYCIASAVAKKPENRPAGALHSMAAPSSCLPSQNALTRLQKQSKAQRQIALLLSWLQGWSHSSRPLIVLCSRVSGSSR